MGHSEIVPGASDKEPDMRARVTRLLLDLDLIDVTLVGESMRGKRAVTTLVVLEHTEERLSRPRQDPLIHPSSKAPR